MAGLLLRARDSKLQVNNRSGRPELFYKIFSKIHCRKIWAVHIAEAVIHRCSVKKVFLEISKDSQENTCARVSFLIKLQRDSGTGVFA